MEVQLVLCSRQACNKSIFFVSIHKFMMMMVREWQLMICSSSSLIIRCWRKRALINHPYMIKLISSWGSLEIQKVLLTLNESSKTQDLEIYTWEKNTHTQFTVHKVASWCWGDAGQLKKVLICFLCERSHENETQKPKGKLSQSWLGTGHVQSSSVRYSAWRQRTISSLLVSQPSSIYQESKDMWWLHDAYSKQLKGSPPGL